VHIKSSGVRFDSKSGAASTERPASFQFDRGEGKSVGARYDPATRELHMHNEVALTWFGSTPGKQMEVQAGSLVYHEAESKIFLTPWTKFKRGTLAVEAAGTVVTLVDGAIQHIEAQQARGVETQPKRQLEFAADGLRMRFNAEGEVENLIGERNAKLVSTAASAQTTVTSNRVDLEFEASAEESTLKKALATGGSVVESKPRPRSGSPLPDTRIVKSQTIVLYMRPAGEEIDRVETESPGTVEFIPNAPGQRKRLLTGERMSMAYGVENQIRTFRASNVSTRTEREPVKGKPPLPPALTWSKDLSAEFDEKTGDLKKMEPWDDFRYVEGERRAKAQRAILTAP
jgi:lipopolysaccharide export system protein LptA